MCQAVSESNNEPSGTHMRHIDAIGGKSMVDG